MYSQGKANYDLQFYDHVRVALSEVDMLNLPRSCLLERSRAAIRFDSFQRTKVKTGKYIQLSSELSFVHC